MFTGNSDTSFLLKAAELKLTKYLIKPVKRQELKEAISLVNKELEKFHIISRDIIYLKDNFYWDNYENLLYKDNKQISLTKIEREILKILFQSFPNITIYDYLLFHIWDDLGDKSFNALKTAIKKLRKKLPPDTIENIYATGYKLIL